MPQDYFSEYFIYCSLFIFFGADLDNSFYNQSFLGNGNHFMYSHDLNE